MISRAVRRATASSKSLSPVSLRRVARMPIHHLMIGTWTPPGAIFTVAFDDEKLTLELVHRTPIPEDEPISWMTFDHGKKNIYGAAMKKWSSFAVKSPTEIIHETSHPIGGDRELPCWPSFRKPM
jgi:carboxy-cis,cis-muconate cyclase